MEEKGKGSFSFLKKKTVMKLRKDSEIEYLFKATIERFSEDKLSTGTFIIQPYINPPLNLAKYMILGFMFKKMVKENG